MKYILKTSGKEIYIYRKYWLFKSLYCIFPQEELKEAIEYLNYINEK